MPQWPWFGWSPAGHLHNTTFCVQMLSKHKMLDAKLEKNHKMWGCV